MPMIPFDAQDQLPAPTVRNWAEDKYLHVEHYARMFATAMKGKWSCRVYLELFAGAGRAAIEDSTKIVDTASLRTLTLEPGFDLHAYGELDAQLLAGLEQRCRVRRPGARLVFVLGDVNETWPTLQKRIRDEVGHGTHLTFCFVDPFRCADFSFATIRGLSESLIDFLVLVPSFMDANRNESVYTRTENSVLDRFLGNPSWRVAWLERPERKMAFGSFVAHQFGLGMKALGFKYDGLQDMKLMRSTDHNLPLYHLAFFSRHDVGLKLWREALKSSTLQRGLQF